MTAVTPSTNRDSPWIAWAGVETGAKMFVGLRGEGVDCAEVVAARKHSPKTKGATRMREWCGCVVDMSLVDGATWRSNHEINGPPGSKKRAPGEQRTAWLYVDATQDDFPHTRRQSRGMA
jgi:hypothetical protein